MRTMLRVFATVCLIPAALGAQAPVTATSPSDATGAFLAPRLIRIDAMVNRLVAEQRIPGAVVMLVRDGKVEYHKAYGYRNLGTKAPMRTDDIFRIASQTKAQPEVKVSNGTSLWIAHNSKER